MNENEEHDYEYTIHMSIRDVRLMSHCVDQAIKNWSGGPPEEQQQLNHMKRQFQRMILDYQFNNS